MTINEAKKLKPGDLVMFDNRHKVYGKMVFEVIDIHKDTEKRCYRVTLKQPGFDYGFRIENAHSHYLHKLEV